MSNVDLHCHSRFSDGTLSPRQIVERAVANGVTLLALTDHDEVGGLAEAREAASGTGMAFVDGVEISVTWEKRTVHVVGLAIDPNHAALLGGIEQIREGRSERARQIADALSRAGIPGSLDGAYGYAENKHLIGRTHFARFLVEHGYAKSVRAVFRKFLVDGKPGFVSHRWAELGDAVAWITAAGGVPVLAHPGRYGMGREKLERLFGEFRDAGGRAAEVVTSSHTADQFPYFAGLVTRFDLLASRGSDFHGPGEGYRELGRLPALPGGCVPVWSLWSAS